MQIQVKADKDWDVWERKEVLEFAAAPENNGGNSLPEGTDLEAFFSSVSSMSLAVWVDGKVSLRVSLIPVDHIAKIGMFHVTGDGRLGPEGSRKIAQSWLNGLVEKGYKVRAVALSPVVMRWGRRIGFEVWGKTAGGYVGEYVPHT